MAVAGEKRQQASKTIRNIAGKRKARLARSRPVIAALSSATAGVRTSPSRKLISPMHRRRRGRRCHPAGGVTRPPTGSNRRHRVKHAPSPAQTAAQSGTDRHCQRRKGPSGKRGRKNCKTRGDQRRPASIQNRSQPSAGSSCGCHTYTQSSCRTVKGACH